MQISIRNAIFETNSSSVHAITLIPRDEVEQWLDGHGSFNAEGRGVSYRNDMEEDRIRAKSPSYYDKWEWSGGIKRDDGEALDDGLGCMIVKKGVTAGSVIIDKEAFERNDDEISVDFYMTNEYPE